MDEAKPFSISKREVWEAFKRVKANQGAAGVDGQSILEFEANLSGNLYRLWNRLSSGSYFPPPVRAVEMESLDGADEVQFLAPNSMDTGAARIEVVRDAAERGLGEADYVISGLPFSTLPPGVGDAIAAATAKVIRNGGAFLVYQFSPKVRDFIQPWFDRIERGFEWINVPPATLFWAWKDPAED